MENITIRYDKDGNAILTMTQAAMTILMADVAELASDKARQRSEGRGYSEELVEAYKQKSKAFWALSGKVRSRRVVVAEVGM